MNVYSFVVADTQSPKLVQERNRLFDNIPLLAKPRPIFSSAFCDNWSDVSLSQFKAMRLGIISAVG